MQPLEDFRFFLIQLISSPAFQQLFPLLVILLVPLLVVAANSRKGSLVSSTFMVFDAFAGALPWNWFDSHSGSSSTHEKRKPKKKHIRTRAGQVKQEQHQLESFPKVSHDAGYYPGLVNISGTYCFMDSTLQAMASLCYLQPQIEQIHAKAEALDVPTPVIDALRDLLHTLNTPTSSPRALRPLDIINALSNNSPSKHNTLFSSREHQDAQELFQLLSECIKNETAAVEKEGHRDRGLSALAQVQGPASRELGKSVFDGLTANRRSCVECGYTEAVMHFAFDNWQLSMPRLATQCRLEDCLDDYTRLEILTDCICRKCSMLATYRRLEVEAEKLTELANADQDPTASKKKRAREARKLVARVKAALDDGRIEEDIKGVKMEKVFSRASTKQAMIARPPRVLALHLNRSVHYGHYASKNTCRVLFPDVLDLTHTRPRQLSTSPLKRRCERYGPVRDDEDEPPKTGRGWLRISDDSVVEIGIENVLQEGVGAFMIFYERVAMPRQSVYLSNSPRSSEETVRPECVHANGSCASLANGDAAEEVKVMKPIPKIVGPRVIHRVSAQPSSRSSSLSPPERDPIPRPVTQALASTSVVSEKSLPNGHAAPSGKNHVPSTMPSEDTQPALVRPASPQQQIASPTPHILSPPSISSPTEPPPSPSIAVDLRA
ncbi:uncharacterized protein B0H18DRAFT_1003829 [Fomitopsis serialis]|uniref:uncharacterized protein n=1 Tax=Fomitopsis serialis TaxID=139415 RepID=UPI0020074857|nr:uncharacterized protein B0H18DRAFT_1003829 [Neoantrodia serialis]KAH9927275.1 hypothetical protein B0H18DRAFT_1003829 [Neoantrodia serialis]